MRWLGWVIGLPLALVVVIFAVANRHDVRLEAWPLPWAVDVPVYLVVLGALALGMVVGAIVMWLSGHGSRRRAREQSRRAQSLERQLTALDTSRAV